MVIQERHVIIFSIAMFVIATGLFTVMLSIHTERSIIEEKRPFIATVNIEELCRVGVNENKWEYIIIHHSATNKGNAKNFDDYHRETRKWEYGLAYHFVIGNGSYSRDGEIEIGERWVKQIHGAHTSNMDYNRVSIGICFVGNFEEEGGPTYNQTESFVGIVNYLIERYKIPKSNIIRHSEVTKKHTVCPGKNFPYKEIMYRIGPSQPLQVNQWIQNT